MSNTLALPSATFTDAEKTDIRRFCGYPAYGNGNQGFQSWRFFQWYGVLEFRLNNLSSSEYQVVRNYLNTLYILEQAIPDSSDDIVVQSAAIFTKNPNEILERDRLFRNWSRKLCGFLGIPAGEALGTSGSRIIM